MSSLDRFLDQNLTKYIHTNLVRSEITTTLQRYPELRAKFDNFTENSGKTQKLISLEGTIPVTYMGCVYNIPIAIILHNQYPHTAPVVYVRPTSNMQIKPSKFVENTGLVSLPYIAEWKHPENDLTGLIAILQIIFGEQSPVFSKHSSTIPIPPKTYQNFQQNPKPITNGGTQNPYMNQIGSGWQSPNPVVSMPVPQLSPYPVPYQSTKAPPGFCLNSSMATQPSIYGPYNEDHLKSSVLSAVLDQVTRIRKVIVYQHSDDILAMQQTRASLKAGNEQIQEMLQKISREKERVLDESENLKKSIKALEEVSTRVKEKNSNFDVDEAVDTTAPLYRQLVDSFAEEQAIEDAIYYLGEAISKEVLDIEVYLKKVRELSRKQFMLRATVQKCREKAGLPAV